MTIQMTSLLIKIQTLLSSPGFRPKMEPVRGRQAISNTAWCPLRVTQVPEARKRLEGPASLEFIVIATAKDKHTAQRGPTISENIEFLLEIFETSVPIKQLHCFR